MADDLVQKRIADYEAAKAVVDPRGVYSLPFPLDPLHAEIAALRAEVAELREKVAMLPSDTDADLRTRYYWAGCAIPWPHLKELLVREGVIRREGGERDFHMADGTYVGTVRNDPPPSKAVEVMLATRKIEAGEALTTADVSPIESSPSLSHKWTNAVLLGIV